jgi:hypothetical protein
MRIKALRANTFEPGEIAIVRKGAIDCLPEHWGIEITVLHGPEIMAYWAAPNADIWNTPPDHSGPCYFCRTPVRDGWVLADSLEKRKPPREPLGHWEDIPFFNPTLVTA